MKKTVRFGWLAYELRGLGRLGVAMPVFVVLGFAAVAALMALTGATERQVARVLAAVLEVGVPLAAGLAAASVVTGDPAADLHLTLRTRYRTTVLRRLAILFAWTATISASWALVLRGAGLWSLWVPEPFLTSQLGWMAPLSWCVSFGALLALVLRGSASSGAILGGLWVSEHLFGGLMFEHDWLRPFFLFATTYTPGMEYWLGNRLVLIASALVLMLGVALMLRRGEALVSGGDA